MKESIKKRIKRVADALASLGLILFFCSGWVMYVSTLIERNESHTKTIEDKTQAVADSIIKETTHYTHYRVPDNFLREMDELEATNRELRDSLAYYSMFYRLANRRHEYDYEFSAVDSADYRIYSGNLKETVSHDTIKVVEQSPIDSTPHDSIGR